MALRSGSSSVKAPQPIININVGVMGHVDSGKTSLVRALSTELSTAALDKHPQSRERGITLDLGFSAFLVDENEHKGSSTSDSFIQDESQISSSKIQFTLVDCPGHSSLIKTIIGGAQIIDIILLVVDITKGIQAQTLECLVIGEITCNKLVIALNKADQLLPPPSQRQKERQSNSRELSKFQRQWIKERLEPVIVSLREKLKETHFREVVMVPVAAAAALEDASSGQEGNQELFQATLGFITEYLDASSCPQDAPRLSRATSANPTIEYRHLCGITELIQTLKRESGIPARHFANNLGSESKENPGKTPFMISIDHCFALKGKGTVVTGTVLSGKVCVGDTIEFPLLKTEHKVKSMQMFHRSVRSASQGDRVGLCVPGLDADQLERGLAASPGAVRPVYGGIALVQRVKYYPHECKSKTNFHITVGHTTVVGSVRFFRKAVWHREQEGQQEKENDEEDYISSSLGGGIISRIRPQMFDWSLEYETLPSLCDPEAIAAGGRPVIGEEAHGVTDSHFAYIDFSGPVMCPMNSLLIASRLDGDADRIATSESACRIAFFGRFIESFTGASEMGGSEGKRANRQEKSVQASQEQQQQRQREGLKIVKYSERSGILRHKAGASKSATGAGAGKSGTGASSKKTMALARDIGTNAKEIEVLVTDLFSKETNMNAFIGLKLISKRLPALIGEITSAFGASGKCKAKFSLSSPTSSLVRHKGSLPLPESIGQLISDGDRVLLPFKKTVKFSSSTFPTSLSATSVQKEKQKKTKATTLFQDEDTLLRCQRQLWEGLEGLEGPLSSLDIGRKDDKELRKKEEKEEHNNAKNIEEEKRGGRRRTGEVERLKGETTDEGRNPMAICNGLFESFEEAERYVSLSACVYTELGEKGAISGTFGKAGKVKVTFPDGTLAAKGCKVFIELERKRE